MHGDGCLVTFRAIIMMDNDAVYVVTLTHSQQQTWKNTKFKANDKNHKIELKLDTESGTPLLKQCQLTLLLFVQCTYVTYALRH